MTWPRASVVLLGWLHLRGDAADGASSLGGQGQPAAAAVGEGEGHTGEGRAAAADGHHSAARLEPPSPGRHRRLDRLHQGGEAAQVEVDDELVIQRRLVRHELAFELVTVTVILASQSPEKPQSFYIKISEESLISAMIDNLTRFPIDCYQQWTSGPILVRRLVNKFPASGSLIFGHF